MVMKILKSFSKLILFLLITSSIALSQSKGDRFFVSADFASFRYDKDNAYLEFYYSFNQNQFKFLKSGDSFNASAIISLEVRSMINDSVVLSNRWKNPIKTNDTSANVLSRQMTGVQGFEIPNGKYRAIVACYDENNISSRDSLSVEFECGFPDQRLALSDIQLSSQIRQVEKDEKNIFYKNTLEVIPHPNALFGIGLPIMYLYLEAYNLKKITGDYYKFDVQILDQTGNVLKNMTKPKKKINESSVEVSTINCSDLPSGSYLVKCVVVDSADTNNLAVSLKRFYIYNPQITPSKSSVDMTSLITSEYGAMTEEDLDREFDMVKYISVGKEKDEYSGLTSLEAKKTFMVNFWKNRDLDDDPSINLYKDKYKKNIRYANQTFKTGFKEGWKTDRGRIFLIYGVPDEVERHPNEMNSKPYEVWYYHSLEGGVQFVFVDRGSMGDYILIHSTHRNEISDTDWEKQLR